MNSPQTGARSSPRSLPQVQVPSRSGSHVGRSSTPRYSLGGHSTPRYNSTGPRPSIVSSILDGGPSEVQEKSSQSFLEEMEKDPTFSLFLTESFDVTLFASQVLGTGSAAASSRKLSDGIQLLEKQLRHEVVARHEELLAQVSSLRDTENVLALVRSGVDSLQSSVQRVRGELADPYSHIKDKTRQLAALHEAIDLLRHVIRVLKLSQKLRDQMTATGSGRMDLAKAAQLYSEIEGIRKEADLTGIEVVEAEVSWLSEVGQQIRVDATRSLEAGMESLNQAEVASVLQVFYNMGELRHTVDLLLGKYRTQVTRAIATALDMKAISADQRAAPGPGGVSRAGTPGLGTAPKARDALWARLNQCSDTVHGVLLAVWHLQRVLAKKRDPITHVCFLNEAVPADEAMPTERIWEAFTRALSNQMKSAFTASSFVKETFVSGYPKLASVFDALVDRLLRDTDVKGVPPAVRREDQQALATALAPFRQEYLAQSLKSLTDAVNNVFPSTARGTVPNSDQMSRLANRLLDEIQAVQSDAHLTALVMRGVAKTLQLLAEKSEYQVATGPESRQVTGPATPAQLRNFAICLHLQEFHLKMAAILPRLPSDESRETLSVALGAVHGVASDAVTQLFRAMVERIEGCILQMYEQKFGSDDINEDTASPATNCSRYMEEVQKAILHFRSKFLSKLLAANLPTKMSTGGGGGGVTGGGGGGGEEESIVMGLTRRMAGRVLLFFVRHAALVRPLSEAGKLRMARDMAELELCMGQNLFPVEQLGPPYRALRAFRPLIFLETDQITSSPLLQELPPSVVLHHLYSRAADELQSPYQRANTTPAKYSLWLDQHSEEEAWKGIKATLDVHARKVTARGDKEFSPVYPLMMQLGQSLFESGTKPWW